jgi:hypothetical protein
MAYIFGVTTTGITTCYCKELNTMRAAMLKAGLFHG